MVVHPPTDARSRTTGRRKAFVQYKFLLSRQHVYYQPGHQFQGIQGPTDPQLPMTELEGYQPVSRIGEVVVNAFVDSYEFSVLDDTLDEKDLTGDASKTGGVCETKPHFHEWATVLPGMICLARKQRNATFRNYVAAGDGDTCHCCAAGRRCPRSETFTLPVSPLKDDPAA